MEFYSKMIKWLNYLVTTTSTTTTSTTTILTSSSTKLDSTTIFSIFNTTSQTQSVIGFNNISSSQLNGILTNAVGSITGCLLSCSNQGSCSYDSVTKQIGCVCNQYYTGSSCQYDLRPCSSDPCLNSGLCNNIGSTFICTCQSIFYGTFCENQVNLCLNSSCESGQSKCVQNGTTTQCICFNGYTGLNCESLTESLKVTKSLISFTSILAFIILGSFVFGVIFMDCLKYVIIKDKRRKRERGFNEKLKNELKRQQTRKAMKKTVEKTKYKYTKGLNSILSEKASALADEKTTLHKSQIDVSQIEEPLNSSPNDRMLNKFKKIENVSIAKPSEKNKIEVRSNVEAFIKTPNKNNKMLMNFVRLKKICSQEQNKKISPVPTDLGFIQIRQHSAENQKDLIDNYEALKRFKSLKELF